MMENILFCLKSFCLGIVEGVTEFLPISSTGHLIVFEKLLGFQGSSQYLTAYSYIIQLGAILAVIVLYRQKILATLHVFSQKRKTMYGYVPILRPGYGFG